MKFRYYRLASAWTAARATFVLLFMGAALLSSNSSFAQSVDNTCFPSCSETDGRFITVAGSGVSTLVGDTIKIRLATLAHVDSLVVGIFDGETGGMFDGGQTPLRFTLYADSAGDGTGRHELGSWNGNTMTDNKWHTIKIRNVPQARALTGNYFYVLMAQVIGAAPSTQSSFKIRVNGTISIEPGLSFDVMAPLSNAATAAVIYPNYPSLDTTTYDGDWTFYINMPRPVSSIILCDGDADYGSFDGTDKDEDDPDTRSDRLPKWAVNNEALLEGVARGLVATDSAGVAIDDSTTGAPSDQERRPLFARGTSIFYEIIDPLGNHYVNDNPSGNREWEQFRISTAPFDRTQMDYHADSLPAGIYRLHVYGMDLGNMNAFRLFTDSLSGDIMEIIGTDGDGGPVAPLPPTNPDTAMAKGLAFIDADNDGVRDANEPIMAGMPVVLTADYNNDGQVDHIFTTTTDEEGKYKFEKLKPGRYKVKMDTAGMSRELLPTWDSDGITTPNLASMTLGGTNPVGVADFGYRRLIGVTIAGADTVANGTTQTYTATASVTGASYAWSVSGPATIVGSRTGSSVTISVTGEGPIQLTVTASKDGSSATARKPVRVTGSDFVLFAYDYLYFKGRSGDASAGFITGNVGVNKKASTGCGGGSPTLVMGNNCGTANAVYLSNNSRVIGDYVSLSSAVSVYDLFANRTTGSTNSATKRHAGPTSYSGQAIPTAQLPVIPQFSYGSTSVTVSTNGTRTLAPGNYCVITLNNGATLNLGAGIYNIKSIRGGEDVTINTNAATKVRIARDMLLGDSAYVGSANTALFIVRSDGVCSGNPSVDMGKGSEFHGQVFAPKGEIEIGKGSDLTGRFWSRYIDADYNVNATYFSPVTSLTRANNSGFQKKRLGDGAITGMETIEAAGYPNPFTTATTIRFELTEQSEVTLELFDGQGRTVRRIADGLTLGSGAHGLEWDGRDAGGTSVPNGAYFFRLRCGEIVQTGSILYVGR